MLPPVVENPAALLQLLRLSSPLLPIGAFAYSQGLEQAAHLGVISGPADLESWLGGIAENVLPWTDLAVLARAFEAADRGQEPGVLLQLSALMLALRESAELRAEEQQLGSALARLLAQQDVARAGEFVGSEEASYVVMYGVAAAHYGLSKRGALLGYCFAWLENQISAALRCMSIGQVAAQGVLCSVMARVPLAVEKSLLVTDDELGFSAPAYALVSIGHETLYSRLFRS
jgi:urease accessory protein